MGVEKSPRWDEITIQGVWQELQEPVTLTTNNKAFQEGVMEISLKKGLFKVIPLKYWRPIFMMLIIYKIVAKVLVLRLDLVLNKILTS